LKRPKFFYGYWIVLIAFLCLYSWGGIGYSFSLFVEPLQADLGWGRGEIMLAFTILLLIQAVLSPFVGRIVDLYGARRIIVTGAIVGGLGFVLLTQMHHLWQFYLGYIVISIGSVAIGPIPTSALISNWFKKSRGQAIGIISTGIGVGGVTLAPLLGGYLIPDFGWRASYLALAITSWVLIIPLALSVARQRPADKGLYPDGIKALEPECAAVSDVPPTATKGLTTKMTLASSTFWLIALSFLAGAFSYAGVIQNQASYLKDIGFTAATAASALSGIGVGSAIGKFGFGWLCDRIPPKYACAIGLGLQLAGIININERVTSIAYGTIMAVCGSFRVRYWELDANHVNAHQHYLWDSFLRYYLWHGKPLQEHGECYRPVSGRVYARCNADI
jgi:MFS family permease